MYFIQFQKTLKDLILLANMICDFMNRPRPPLAKSVLAENSAIDHSTFLKLRKKYLSIYLYVPNANSEIPWMQGSKIDARVSR